MEEAKPPILEFRPPSETKQCDAPRIVEQGLGRTNMPIRFPITQLGDIFTSKLDQEEEEDAVIYLSQKINNVLFDLARAKRIP